MSNANPAQPLFQHLEKLMHFAQVLQSGSIQAAAQKLKLSQSSLSRSMRVLEEALDCRLLIRGRKGVFPTDEGKSVQKFALSIIEQGQDLWGDLANIERKSITIGTHEVLASVLWPPLVREIKRSYKNLKLNLVTAVSASDLLKRLESREVDLILAVELKDSLNFICQKFMPSTWRMYASPEFLTGRPKNIRAKFSKSEISASSLLFLPQGVAGNGRTLTTLLPEMGIINEHPIMVQSMESAQTLAVAGVGIAILPQFFAGLAVSEKKLIPIEIEDYGAKGFGAHTVYLAHRRERSDQVTFELAKIVHDLAQTI